MNPTSIAFASAYLLIFASWAHADFIALKTGRTYGGPDEAGFVIETEKGYTFKSYGERQRSPVDIPKEQVDRIELGFERKPVEDLKPGQWERYFEKGKELCGKEDAAAREVGKRLILLAIKNEPDTHYAAGHFLLAETTEDGLQSWAYYRRAILANPSVDPEVLNNVKALQKSGPPWEKLIVLLSDCLANDPVAASLQLQEIESEEELAIDLFLLQNLQTPLRLETIREEVKRCVKEKRKVEETTAVCPECNGEGRKLVTSKKPSKKLEAAGKCFNCNGRGKVMANVRVSGTVTDRQAVKCRFCNGTGKDSSSVFSSSLDSTTYVTCKKCQGTGQVKVRKVTEETDLQKAADLSFTPEISSQFLVLLRKADARESDTVQEHLDAFSEKLKTSSYREFDDLDYEKTVFRGCEWAKPEEASEK